MNNKYLQSRQVQIKPLMDKLAALKLDISTLQNQKELSESQIKDNQELLSSINEMVDTLNSDFLESIENIDIFILNVKNIISSGTQYIKNTEDVISQYFNIVKALEVQIHDSQKKLFDIKGEQAIALKRIQDEDARLSVLKRDLDIYKIRLQAKAKELGINIAIRF